MIQFLKYHSRMLKIEFIIEAPGNPVIETDTSEGLTVTSPPGNVAILFSFSVKEL